MTIKATYPWFSPDSATFNFYTGDSQEQIDRCLNCPHQECCDCLSDDGVKRKHNIMDDGVQKVVLKNSQKNAARLLGVTTRTIARYRASLKRMEVITA